MSGFEGALAPPPGVTPNFEHPHDVLRTVNLVTQALSIPTVSFFVMLRMFAKYRLSRALGADDCEWTLKGSPVLRFWLKTMAVR